MKNSMVSVISLFKYANLKMNKPQLKINRQLMIVNPLIKQRFGRVIAAPKRCDSKEN